LSEYAFGIDLGTFIILVAGVIYGVTFWFMKRKEDKEYEKLMDDPFDLNFLIPSAAHFKINYAKQDEANDKLEKELSIPVNSEDYIFLHIKPKINLTVTQRFFGFEGGPNKPELTYSNPFRTEGSDTIQWYKDWYGYFHILGDILWLRDEIVLPAFKIKTHEKGDFKLNANFYVGSKEWKSTKKEINRAIVKTLDVKVI
jgi:hypothetical protein